MKTDSLDDFYRQTQAILPEGIGKEIGHFNVFSVAEIVARYKKKPFMPYNRRTYYKISLIKGHNIAEYADKTIEIKDDALLFATPKVPYNWVPQHENQAGHFCIFTDEFLTAKKSGVVLDDLPIFKVGGYPVFQLAPDKSDEINAIFDKLHVEIASNYVYKYDLIRNYVLELIHFGQKLQPATDLYAANNGSSRVAALFIELLERQFPVENIDQKLLLTSAKDYADRLSIHVNYLNKVLKITTGKTTTEILSNRIIQEAKILLKQTNWNVSEVAYSLGFEETAHFSNFFKKHTSFSPLQFRN